MLLCVSVCLCVCPSVCVSIHLSVCACVCMYVLVCIVCMCCMSYSFVSVVSDYWSSGYMHYKRMLMILVWNFSRQPSLIFPLPWPPWAFHPRPPTPASTLPCSRQDLGLTGWWARQIWATQPSLCLLKVCLHRMQVLSDHCQGRLV